MNSDGSSSWLDRRLVFIDVECPNGRNDRICSIAALFENGELISRLVDPETAFHPVSSKIHGITSDAVYSEPNFRYVWTNELAVKFEGRTIVGYNVVFDLDVLAKTLAAYDILQPIWRYVDLLPVARRCFDLPGYSLSDVMSELGVSFQPHDAVEEVFAAKTLFEEIARNEPDLLCEKIFKFW
ncbi:MAG: hypothetical protein IK077_01955 [Thermoguttaceae bacterium]|nr:hypothetical protein [Thermoguttaceae bacterium]